VHPAAVTVRPKRRAQIFSDTKMMELDGGIFVWTRARAARLPFATSFFSLRK